MEFNDENYEVREFGRWWAWRYTNGPGGGTVETEQEAWEACATHQTETEKT